MRARLLDGLGWEEYPDYLIVHIVSFSRLGSSPLLIRTVPTLTSNFPYPDDGTLKRACCGSETRHSRAPKPPAHAESPLFTASYTWCLYPRPSTRLPRLPRDHLRPQQYITLKITPCLSSPSHSNLLSSQRPHFQHHGSLSKCIMHTISCTCPIYCF